jgi:hypothetical protein
MRVRISKISLGVFLALLLLSRLLLAVPSEYWPWYAVMGIFAVVPLVVGPRWYHLLGSLALIMSVILIVGDYQAGKRFRAHFHLGSVELQPSTALEPAATAP